MTVWPPQPTRGNTPPVPTLRDFRKDPRNRTQLRNLLGVLAILATAIIALPQMTPTGFMLLIGTPMLYFLPAIIAHQRHHRNRTSILILNATFGWTFVGWIILLATSASGNVDSRRHWTA